MSISFSKGSAVSVSETPLEIEIISRTQELTFCVATQHRARGIPYTYRFRLEKGRLYYQFALPPKTVRKEIIRQLKNMNIKAYDAGLKARQVRKRSGMNVEI